LTELLRQRACKRPDKTALTFLADGEDEAESLTYGQLDRRARAIAARLQQAQLSGERVLLLFPPGLGFVTGFLGCLYAGAVAIPTYPPRRRLDGWGSIACDCRPAACLTAAVFEPRRAALEKLVPELHHAHWLTAETVDEGAAEAWRSPELEPGAVAFLQYTSGSTAAPKGVVVTHGNLLHNEAMISRAFEQTEESVVVGWLPLYHDMGLIGNVLQPLCSGARCVLMAPTAFLQKPARWLQAISRYRATTSGGPDFAYELCVRRFGAEDSRALDLASWRVAFNGAEPVRHATLERFAEKFAPYGFRRQAFYPCYGLAEATLFVAGGDVASAPATAGLAGEVLERPARRLVCCGRAWSGQRIVIADPESRKPCAAGQVGEIWVGGPSIARGYWGRPELSEETFHARLAGDGSGPFLRTGDLGFLAGGGLYVTGRIKDLIILRGRNLYPQDVEATAQGAHRDLRPGCGAAFSVDADGEERLVLVHELSRHATAAPEAVCDAIRQAVAELHEAQVYAVALLREGTILKTSSGKVRRRACRAAYLAGELRVVAGSVPPAGGSAAGAAQEVAGVLDRAHLLDLDPARRAAAVEIFLGKAAGRVMGPGALDHDKPLTAQGLDSLAAVELGHAAETVLGVAPELDELLAGTTLRQLAAELASRVGKAPESAAEPLLAPPEDSFPLSHGQRALVFLERLAPESGAYNVAVAARVRGDVDAATLERAVRAAGRRHPMLRAVVTEVGGELRQRVAAGRPDFAVAAAPTAAELREALRERAFAPFDLERGPLLRVSLVSFEDRRVLVLAIHHVVSDFWSLAHLVGEIGRLYALEREGARAEPAPPKRHYAEFVVARQGWLRGAGGEAARDFWERTLAGDPPDLELPADRPRPAVQSYRGDSVAFTVPAAQAGAIRALARRLGATPFMVLAAAWGALLHRLSRQPEVWVGSPTAGRRDPGLADVVGYFVNPIVLRQRFSDRPSFARHVGAVRAMALAAFAHQEYPFALLAERLHARRDPSRSPLFQTMFILQRAPGEAELAAFALGEDGHRMRWGELELESVKLPRRPVQFDLTLSIAELAGGDLGGSLKYASDLFDAATARRLAGSFTELLASAAAQPGFVLESLSTLSAAQRHELLVEWNDTAAGAGQEASPEAALAGQVDRTPDAVAVVMGEVALTFAELDRRSTRLARFLRELGAGPERIVGVAMERSPDLVVALWGILKTAAAYLPLDLSYPAERLRFVARDSAAAVILVRAGHAALFEPDGRGGGQPWKVVETQASAPAIAARGAARLPPAASGHNPAYLIYTSGSTGRPKGVAVPRATVVSFFRGMDRRLGLGGGRRKWLAVTSVSFDISVLELLWTLTRGFTAVLRPEPVSAAPRRLRSRVADRGMALSLMYFSSDVDAAPADRYRLLMEGAKFADREGFEAVWTPERHFHAFGGLFPNPSVTSAAIAAVTERIRIRAGSVVLPLHHPVRVAEEWSVVDNLSGGRVDLSIASGWQPDDFVLAPESFAERKEIMRRGLDSLRALWRGESITLRNGVGQEREVRILPRPIQAELPVWITAAGSRETFELAGEAGAGLLTHLLGQGVEELREKIELYRDAFGRSGEAGQGHVTLMLHAFVGEDPARVREIVREPFTRYLRTSFGLMKSLAPGQDLEAMTEEDLSRLLAQAFNRYFETSGLFGTPQRCLELIDRLKEIGVDEVACLIDFGVDVDTVLASLADLARLRRAANLVAEAVAADETIPAEILRRGISHLQCTPSLARALLSDPEAAAGLGVLEKLMVGGEALAGDLAADLRRRLGGELLNMYGPTETTVWSSVATVASERVGLGRPILDTSLVVADPRLEPAGVGVPGELLIGGRGVVRGYHGRPRLTAERFVPDPFSYTPGERLYRTGDLTRLRHDGQGEFLGRLDHQVKLRGHRVELEEIETAIHRQPWVREAVVLARQDRPGDLRLAAYVVAISSPNGGGRLAAVEEEKRRRLLVGRHTYRLPNGVTVAHLTSPQTQAIYREIFADEIYRRHGLTLEDGATVLDVGANIGLFTLFVHQQCRSPRVLAFEPIPTTFEVLATNVALFGLDVELFNLGLSDRAERARFTFYPEMAGLSGRFSGDDRRATRSIIRRFVERTPTGGARVGEEEIDALVDEYLRGESFECELRPLSSILRERGVERVDLLKVDVERAEVQVLRGIADEDWPKIRQIVLEVHSQDLLVEVKEILERHGFDPQVDEFVAAEDQIDDVHMVYGRRTAAAVGTAAPFSIERLRQALSAELPEYMVPADVVVLERLPLLPNGKIDRAELARTAPVSGAAEPGGAGRRRTPFTPPGDALQRQIADVWRQLLGVEEVGIHDNFFESGGNSLLLMQAHGRLREALGRDFSLVELMRHPTVSTLARYLGNGGSTAAAPAGDASRGRVDERSARQRRAFGRRKQRLGAAGGAAR